MNRCPHPEPISVTRDGVTYLCIECETIAHGAAWDRSVWSSKGTVWRAKEDATN